jgi:hypothetical protein
VNSFEKWLGGLLGQDPQKAKRLLDDRTAFEFLLTWSLFESKCFGGYLAPLSQFENV